jgi:hypothetical protein
MCEDEAHLFVFADDLLIFSEASLNSIKVIKSALLEFENFFGLKANSSKSSFYYSGILDRVKHIILDDPMMKEGQLPVRYLGVPLISFRLSSPNCGALLNKISGRIDSWLSKNLSYVRVGFSCCPLFCTVYKCIGWVFSFFLRELLELLNRNSIGFFGIGMEKVLLRLRFLGLISVFLRRREVWVLSSLKFGIKRLCLGIFGVFLPNLVPSGWLGLKKIS